MKLATIKTTKNITIKGTGNQATFRKSNSLNLYFLSLYGGTMKKIIARKMKILNTIPI